MSTQVPVPAPPSVARSLLVACAVAAATTLFKVALGNALGREAPFAFFGIALIFGGWAGGALSAYLLTPLLTAIWWYFFLEPYGAFTVKGRQTLAPLVGLVVEGVAVSAVLTMMESARRSMRVAVERSQRLYDLAAALTSARTPEEVAEVIVERGMLALDATTASVARPRGDNQATVVATRGLPEHVREQFQVFSLDLNIPGAVAFRTAQPEWIEDAAAFRTRYPSPEAASMAVNGAAVALPLVNGQGRVLAVLGFRFATARQFSKEERASTIAFVAQCTQALERAQLYADEVAAHSKLSELDELTSALSTALTRDDVARVVVERGMDAMAANICTLYVLDESGQRLQLIGDRGVSPEVLAQVRLIDANSGSPVFATLASGESRWIESREEYERFAPDLARIEARGPRARAFWSVPLIAEGKAAGLLGMGFFNPRRFPPEERMFVETFARHCAEALRRAEHLEAERAARALAERLQVSLATTLRSIGDAVIATDARGQLTFMNPVAEALTGWSASEAEGRPLAAVFRIQNEQTREAVETPVERVLREGVVVGLANHTVLVARDGREIPIDDSGAPIRNDRGGIEGMVLVFRDVTRKKREQARLTFLSEATRTLGESLDYMATLSRVAQLAVPEIADWVAVDLLDDAGARQQLAVAHVDPARVQLARELNLRYPPDPNSATGVPAVLRTGRSELYPEISDEMLRAGAHDAEHLRISRELGLHSAMVVPLCARGRTLGAMTFVSAESRQRFTEEDLRFAEDLASRCALALDNARLFMAEQRARGSADQANRAKDEFLATVSHELRTPLNAILGWAKLLSSASLPVTKHLRAVETIERNAVAMAQLIEDLLDVSRIISGKMRLELGPVDLPQVIEAAVESVRPAAEAKSIRLELELDARTGPALGDPTRLQQVIWNLLSNAVKFTGNQGWVRVTLRRLETGIEIEVRDNGKGIQREFMPQLFQAFRQEELGHVQSRSGLGLGLSISKQLVELHGGRIAAFSEGEGRGAAFVVRLPLLEARTEAIQRARDSAPQTAFVPTRSLHGLRVLVVDDDDDARWLVCTVLEECGAEVTAASNANEALALLSTSPPDVLLSDIGMPGKDGYDLIRAVRALPSGQGGDVPAAALTAFARAEDRRRAIHAGYTCHIAKPVEPSELVETVAALGRGDGGADHANAS